MKDPNFSPMFASMYIGLCDIARRNGYALTVHGTMNLDFDLVAIPWVEDACEPIILIKDMARLVGIIDGQIQHGIYKEDPIIRPHGRKSWLLLMGNGAALDISVMPKIS